MEKRYLFLLLGIAVAGAAAATTIYEWKDDQGVLHITDNPDTIPRKYQKKVQERQLDMKPNGGSASGSAGGGAVSPQAPPAAEGPAAAPGQLYGGHPPQWWRDQFASLRGQLEAIQA